MKCDLNCPPIFSKTHVFCCMSCEKKFYNYMTEKKLHKYWSDDSGFWSPGGCRLPRKRVPKICKDYDCKKWRIYAGMDWNGEKWVLGAVLARPIDKCNEEHKKKLISAILC